MFPVNVCAANDVVSKTPSFILSLVILFGAKSANETSDNFSLVIEPLAILIVVIALLASLSVVIA